MSVLATIITIGDEILIGQTVDTNSAWLGSKLSQLGIKVHRIISISDEADEIKLVIDETWKTSRLIILTGGLGPTNDDRTKQALVDYFHDHLVKSEEVLSDIINLLKDRGVPLIESNLNQALIPSSCKIIRNQHGTAPGMWWEREDHLLISLPGVPYEMMGMMENSVLDLLIEHFQPPVILHKTIMTTGLPESYLAELIKEVELQLPTEVSLAYLPSPGIVRLRLTLQGADEGLMKARLDHHSNQIIECIPRSVYGFDGISLQESVGMLLRKHGFTVSTAESCTGGYISHLITGVPGASSYFRGGMVLYENELKRTQLGIGQKFLLDHGAVCQPVVEQMATGIRLKFKTDYSLAVSGIAGPTGAVPGKPVGFVWIAVAGSRGVISQQYNMGEHRERTIVKSALAALNMLRLMILDNIGSEEVSTGGG